MPFSVPPRSAKPRTRGITAMIDFGPDEMGWTVEGGVRDLMAIAASYIDMAKIYALNALLIPEDVLKRIVAIYRDHDVTPYTGGVLFEYAYLRGEVDEMLDLVAKLGVPALEISENYVTLPDDERRRFISTIVERGFQVIWEFGSKNPDTPFDLAEVGALVTSAVACGAHHVILEQSELDVLAAASPDAFARLAEQDWYPHVLIEGDPYRFPKQHAELIKQFGPEVNLANVAPGQCYRLEGLRRGIGRAVDYALFRTYGL
jgi:phosphosulfolactate synthase